MEDLTLEYSAEDMDGAEGQMITMVDAHSLQNAAQALVLQAHQLQDTGGQLSIPHPNDTDQQQRSQEQEHIFTAKFSAPHCLVCNAKLGVSARGAIDIFSDKVKTTHRQMHVHSVLGNLLNQDLSSDAVHSGILCKKCFRLLDDIDSLEGQLVCMKQELTNKYMRTLAIVKDTGNLEITSHDGTSLEEDALNLEATSLTKGDKEFKVYMNSGHQRSRRGRGRGRPPIIKTEVKTEHDVLAGSSHDEIIAGLEAVHSPEPVHQTEEHTLGHQMLTTSEHDEVLDHQSEIIVQEGIIDDGSLQGTVEDVMEVDNLDLGVDEEETQVHAERGYECEVCTERHSTKEALMAHLRQHIESGEKPFGCDFCHRKYALPRQLKEHIRHHMNKSFACTQCPKRYRSDNALQEHYNTHTGHRPYRCDQCDKSFTSKYTLKTHLKTHGVRQRPHKCKLCGKSFLSTHHLTEHMQVHQGKKNFICETCGKAFATQRSLDLHVVSHTGIKNFACSICNKQFARKGEVEDHERIHTGEKPFQCEICGATFTQRSNLQTHKRSTHYEDKRYPCSLCNKAFKRRRLLDYHMMSVHTGERPWKCQYCSAGFVYPEHFKKHLRIHTGEKPYTCEICGKAFNSRDNRNAHKFIHSDKKPYECTLCGAGFMRKPMLASHLQQHGHTENLEQYTKVNPPSVIPNDNVVENTPSPVAATVRSVKLDEDHATLEQTLDSPVQLVRSGVRGDEETVQVVTRPVHIIEADDLHRYIIHTGTGDRSEGGVGHILASLQGQVVEVRADEIDRYTELTSDQVAQVSQVVSAQTPGSNIQQVTVAGDLRPFAIQLEPGGREITLQAANPATSRELSQVGVTQTTVGTITSREITIPSGTQGQTTVLVSGRNVQYETAGVSNGGSSSGSSASTLRKALTDREEIRPTTSQVLSQVSDTRTARAWTQAGLTTSASSFISSD
ncbi:uncharacterized protein LOC143039948 [Oratosquilla oratoria]|uniref:uncharacterized protein LOC143039948 n=1 Tax=Oratosquilla oratoria TaxID=337810 RepID=UPI003F76B85D